MVWLSSLLFSTWFPLYDGFGKVSVTPTYIVLTPKQSVASNETHAALVLSRDKYQTFTLELEFRAGPLRQNPNPWETFWLFFNYQPMSQEKDTNYLLVKPNGLEIGRATGLVDQQFLFTDDKPHAKNAYWHKIKVQRAINILSISFDGKVIFKSEDPAWLGGLRNEDGHLGLYTEDAQVEIKEISIRD